MPVELTERLLGIAPALAWKYTAKYGVDAYDDLLSEANLALVHAARNCDENHETATPLTYLYRCVELTLQNLARRNSRYKKQRFMARIGSIDQLCTEGDGTTIRDFLPDDCLQPDRACETAELIDKVLAKLNILDRTVYKMIHMSGFNVSQISNRLGITHGSLLDRIERINRQVVRIRAKLLMDPEKIARMRKNLNDGQVRHHRIPTPPRTKNQRRAASKFCKDKARAKILQGDIPLRRAVDGVAGTYYLVDDRQQTVYGPMPIYECVRLAGLPPRPVIGRFINEKVEAINSELSEKDTGLRIMKSILARVLTREQHYVYRRGEAYAAASTTGEN